jgi:hypothetical protein
MDGFSARWKILIFFVLLSCRFYVQYSSSTVQGVRVIRNNPLWFLSYHIQFQESNTDDTN